MIISLLAKIELKINLYHIYKERTEFEISCIILEREREREGGRERERERERKRET